MEPAVWRHQHAALAPGADHPLLTFLPHHRVTLAAGNDDAPAGAMAVGLLVGPGVEYGHVAEHLGVRELDEDHASAGAAALIADELVPGQHVGHEVAVPVGPHPSGELGRVVRRFDQLSLGVEVVAELTGIVELMEEE